MATVIQKRPKVLQLSWPTTKLLAAHFTVSFGSFPENSVEYFVSYYDYYQPEASMCLPRTRLLKSDCQRSRCACLATKALMERRDVIIVATVSVIYGWGP